MGSPVSKPNVKVPHFFFGQVSQRNEYNKELIVVSKKMLRRDEYDDWVRKYGQVKNYQKDALLLPESYEIQPIKKFFACCECPADFQMSLSYDRFDYLYKSELVQRKSGKQHYKEQELFMILYRFLVALKEFQIEGRRVGDIRPSQMVITYQKSIKMINVASYPWEQTSLQKILDAYDNKTKFYLAPQEIHQLSQRTRKPGSQAKAEAFSLGVSLLQAATLQNSEELYELTPRSFNRKLMEDRLSQVGMQYPKFHSYLKNIMQVKPQDRYSGGELWSILHLYSESILDCQKFIPNSAKQTSELAHFRSRPHSFK